MQKPLALSIAACLGLAGCQVFEKSETWNQAVRIRPGETTRDPDPSHAYAAKLHSAFAGEGVEHKVVVYQYRYTTRLREEAVGTRTAVVYRDDSDQRYPWWLKDDRLNTPFWLPNGTLEKQISFYIRRKAEVIETKNYPAQGHSGKTALTFAKPAPALRSIDKPQPRVAAARTTPVKKAPVSIFAHKPVTQPAVVKAPANTPTRKVVKAPAPKKKPVLRESIAQSLAPKIKLPTSFFTPPAAKPAASRNSANEVHWTPPAALDTSEQSALTAPRDESLEKRFRALHGTDYNRFSPTDRRKMQQLQHNVASRD